MQKAKYFILSLFFILTILSGNVIAQSYFFKNYSVDDGLPFIQVSAIYQDSKGHLWTGGYGGLSKFDGYTFKNYTPENGLLNHSVTSITEDTQGNVWIGTIDGVNKFDGRIFTSYTIKEGLISNDITCILRDSKGNLWFGTSEGLSKMMNGTFVNYTIQRGLVGNKIKCLYEDRNKNIWIGTDNGMSLFDGEKFKNYSIVEGLIGNTVNGITQDSIGAMWIATSEGVSKLNNNKFINYTTKEGLSDNNAKAIICDKRNNIWVGTDKGITKIHGTQLKNYAVGNEMNSNLVFSIYQDCEQNIWLGTYDGLYKYRSDMFEVYSENEGLNNNFIFTITRDSESKIMAGTTDGGIYKMEGQKFVNCSNDIMSGQINASYKDEKGNILFGTGNGVVIYDGKFFQNAREFDELIGESINLFYKDSKSNLWIGCHNGIYKYDGKVLKKYTLPSFAKNYQVWGIHEDKSGNLWVGTYLGGLFLFDGNTFTEQSQTLNFKSESYFTILEDNDGIIYFSSFNGVYVYNTKTKKTDNFGKAEGISSELVYALAFNNEKTELWAGTNQGLDKIDVVGYKKKGSKLLISYGKDEGFSGVECNTNGVYNDPDGVIWFGTVNGLIKYSPKEYIKNNSLAKININTIRLFYKDTIFPQETRLDYDMNNLSFNYSGICLTNPHKVRYSHILEGFDEKWSPVGYERIATYSNLPPGEYTFKVKCTNNEGVWTETPAQFSFTVKTPFWKTIWFYVALSLIFITGLLISIRMRIRNIERKEKQKTELNKKIANIELQALRAQMNPHFIFNTMSSIQHFIANNDTDAALKYLAKFAKLMRSIIGNSKQQMIPISEELNGLNLYLELEVMRFTDKFEYKIIVDEEIDQNYDRIPSMLIQPYVENSIAHGLLPKQGHGKILIHLQKQQDSILCTIKDNGIGREKSKEFKKNRVQQHKSMGMSITQERLDILNSSLNRNLNAQIVDLYEDGIPTGTKVQIIIPLETNPN
ncbi:MAG: two-component regulator propeller domain-containing protein [Bacteroidota bacterium]